MKVKYVLIFLALMITINACSPKITETGKASFYADKFKVNMR